MTTIAARVSDLFVRCLFGESEPTDGAVRVEGITMNVGFHPERIAGAKDEIRALADEIVGADFRSDGGGGASSLSLCMTKTGEQWGEQRNCQELMCLCMAAGVASYCLPREMWPILPGSVPYVVFDFGT